jgi:hypothetical protein
LPDRDERWMSDRTLPPFHGGKNAERLAREAEHDRLGHEVEEIHEQKKAELATPAGAMSPAARSDKKPWWRFWSV